ncbi:hypothetical protein BDV06DRAFT_195993 [Aspergillus oleicola]
MVNRGPSNGCATCKRRRVKCDEAKPYCWACQRLGLVCGGYKKFARLKFRDQNHKFIGPGTKGTGLDKGQGSTDGAIGLLAAGALNLQLQSQPEPDTSVPFFLLHYAAMGRDLGSARGFFEVLIPVYLAQRQGSALSMAVEAVAKEVLGLWLCGHGNAANISLQSNSSRGGTKAEPDPYTQAVRCLRRTIQDREQRGRPATVMAVLALQLYENIAAVYGLRAASPIHHDGALSLLPFVDLKSSSSSDSGSDTVDGDSADAMASEYIRRFILHTEISSAMRQQRPVRSSASSYSSSSSSLYPRVVLGWEGLSLLSAPDNPSSTLDAIGAYVAEFQARYGQLITQMGSFIPSSSREILAAYRAEAKHLDEQLLAWARDVPDHWHPMKVKRGQGIDPSIATYRSFCEVYPYCQIGTIWNLWRVQRLLLVKIILSALSPTMTLHVVPGEHEIELLPKEATTGSPRPTQEETEDFITYAHAFQELVDSICDSVPFYLGNRVNPSTMADFTDPAILLPVYPKQFPAAPAPAGGMRNWSSAEEHKRHVIAQGPWHIMSPLSRLLTLFTEDDHGHLMATFLRPGQHQWIRKQFLRVTTLIRVRYPSVPAGVLDIKRVSKTGATVEDLARGIRKGAIFMSGP